MRLILYWTGEKLSKWVYKPVKVFFRYKLVAKPFSTCVSRISRNDLGVVYLKLLCKFNIGMLATQVIKETFSLSTIFKNAKSIINKSTMKSRFIIGWTVRKKVLFKSTHKYFSKTGPQRRADSHSISMFIEMIIKNEMTIFYWKFKQFLKLLVD